MKLKRSFYNRLTVEVTKDLIGKFLVHKIDGKILAAEITETEAYAGFEDRASHASRGKTQRNEIMFGLPGFSYVYLIYGMYYCLNIVTEKKDYPAAVLIRGLDYPNADGPGKLCREFKITKEIHNGLDLIGNILWVEDRGIKREIIALKRVGVDYAGSSKDWLWRFKRKDH
ncbi:MAG: DNA-3-methyladenine glycosylase [Patescibacteria group bacterium]|nr:DNA-3-methyladenine glycosylase [Patescibacteria group bacterium]